MNRPHTALLTISALRFSADVRRPTNILLRAKGGVQRHSMRMMPRGIALATAAVRSCTSMNSKRAKLTQRLI